MTRRPSIDFEDLLGERVKDLRAIDEMLEGLARNLGRQDLDWIKGYLQGIRNDVADMVRKAEAEHTSF